MEGLSVIKPKCIIQKPKYSVEQPAELSRLLLEGSKI